MRCSDIIKGFIDPRRGDTITVNFDFPDEWNNVPKGGEHQFFILMMKKYPWINQLPKGRGGDLYVNSTRVYFMSGEGPCPPFPIPLMEDVDAPPCAELVINLIECSLECNDCKDGFCNNEDVLRYGEKECANRHIEKIVPSENISTDNGEKLLSDVGLRAPSIVTGLSIY